MSVDAAVEPILPAYDGMPRSVRVHTAARARTCPFEALEARVPSGARVLDVGCGHGLLSNTLALSSPGRTVRGVDIDREKLPFARRAAEVAGLENVTFEAVDPEWTPDGEWDAIVIVDVLYLMGPHAARELLQRLAGALAPGGVLLVKEIDTNVGWKYQLARMQELIATRIVRITEGSSVRFLTTGELEATLDQAGLVVTHLPLHKGRLHPHHLVIGRKPGAPE